MPSGVPCHISKMGVRGGGLGILEGQPITSRPRPQWCHLNTGEWREMGSGRPREGPREEKILLPLSSTRWGAAWKAGCVLGQSPGLFLSALQTGPLPGLCGWGTALCLLLLALLLPSPLSWGILQSSASGATEEQERCIPPRPSRHLSHLRLPPAPPRALPVPEPWTASSSPRVPEDLGKWGSP